MKNGIEIKGDICEVILQPSPIGERFRMLIDTADLSLVASLPGSWYALKSPHYTTHYGRTNVRMGPNRQGTVQIHSLIMQTPKGMVVDHRNRNGLDNRRENLRIVTQATNALNRRSPVRSSVHGIRGVVKDRKSGAQWRAQISVQGNLHVLGHYHTTEEASCAVREFLVSRGVPVEGLSR